NDDGVGSLRDAIETAASGDTIIFSVSLPATITLSNTLIIGINLTITGPGSSNLAISGGKAVRVFSISSGVTVLLSGITIKDGSSDGGGGIYNNGTLTIANSTLSGNSATVNNGGGAILNYFGNVTLFNSTLSSNSGGLGSGGGIASFFGIVALNNSTISGNSAYFGGGIDSKFGTVALANSTLEGNSASYGGGIHLVGHHPPTGNTFK